MWVLPVLASLMAQTPWIVDSDCGSDDYMAVSYLLEKSNVKIEAILSVNGLAHAAAGARNMKRLAGVAVPVYVGAERALVSTVAFPEDWRKTSDELPGVTLAPMRGGVEKMGAVDWLASRLKKPARILALGPLTNLALVLRKDPSLAANVTELVIMGGAIDVPGNLLDGGYYKTKNRWAEWNFYIDPEAVELVFRHVKTIKLVPLDATNKVPFKPEHLPAFNGHAVMKQIMKMDEPLIREGVMYAWDPLAAVAVGAPSLVKFVPVTVSVKTGGDEAGRTARSSSGVKILTAVPPAAEVFHREFAGVFQTRRTRP